MLAAGIWYLYPKNKSAMARKPTARKNVTLALSFVIWTRGPRQMPEFTTMCLVFIDDAWRGNGKEII